MSALSSVIPAPKVYELALLNKKTVKFRPFNVREEKNILIAMQDKEENQLLQLKETLAACTFNKVDIDTLAVAEVELLFVSIRNKSLGETLEVSTRCKECGTPNSIVLDLEQIHIVKPPKVEPEIQLEDNLWVTMKYPSIDSAYKMVEKQTDDGIIEMIADCLVSVISGEEQIDCNDESKQEKIEFVEGLNHSHLEKIGAFLASAPRIKYVGSFNCNKCSSSNPIEVEGLQNFFG